jgi:hypothetical protein
VIFSPRSRLQLVAAVAVFVVAASSCSFREYGTSGTSIVVTNTCADSLVVRLTGEKWDRSAEDQRKGERAAVGVTVDATAINPPDESEGLVLRISPDEGEPLFVVPVERDRDLKLSISPEACPFALGAVEGSCDPVIEGDQEFAIVCR